MIVAGLISGTSVDGIDVALVEIRGRRVRPKAHYTFPYPAGVREAVLGISNAVTHTAQIARLNVLLGELFGKAVRHACRRARLRKIDLIGSHGQTIYHQGRPERLLGRKVARFFQIENKMDAVVRYDLAEEIPVVEESAAR